MANKKAEEPEHVSSSSSESGSDDEQHDGAQQGQQEGEGSPSRSRQSRNEKKARKAVSRLGMKPMPEIVKVVIHKTKQVRTREGGLSAVLPYCLHSTFIDYSSLSSPTVRSR